MRDNYRKELMRRDPTTKGISNKTVKVLIDILKLDTYKITNREDITFIKGEEKDIREMLINRQNEIEHTVTRSNITNDDRLRFLEAILHDDVKELYLET